MAVPKLIVFDLDYTLWPFWVDDPPFSIKRDGQIHDCNGQRIHYYEPAQAILERLHTEGYQLAVASRSGATREANELLALLNWDKYFRYKEIYPGSKTAHFRRFAENSGLDYRDMLFFDDETRNILEISQLGVTCVLADDGINEEVLQKGFKKFAKNSKSSEKNSS